MNDLIRNDLARDDTLPNVKLLDVNSYPEILRGFSWEKLWALFDGNREVLNLAHECIDRHRGKGTAISVKFDTGHSEHYTFDTISRSSSQFAHWLEQRGIGRGDRVAIMLEPGFEYYTCMFGAIKRGAIAVPLFTLFGPDALALRIADCSPKLLLSMGDSVALSAQFPGLDVVTPDRQWRAELESLADTYQTTTRADDLAVFQYTSGTTRALPEAVKHTHRAVVTVMIAALYGTGLRPGDRYFCPSSPAWGHGLWHGTIAPLALGIHVGAYAGKFDAQRILEALAEFAVDNMAAAPTVYRMLRNSGLVENYPIRLRKLSYTGEPLDSSTAQFLTEKLGVIPCSMYGSTEVGVILVNYPGVRDYQVQPGALGKPAPGWDVDIIDAQGMPVPDGVTGEIAVRRKGEWFYIKDRGYRNEDGYFYHAGRSDDVIISAGWTMSAVEIEDTLLTCAGVAEAAVVGVADDLRGQVVRAYIVSRGAETLSAEAIQGYLKERLSRHEYPRQVRFVQALPKTPAGKIDRKVLKEWAKEA